MSLRPLPNDPDAGRVKEMFDLGSEEWLLAAAGDYQTAAVEAMRNDGAHFQRLVALEWPARVNRSEELRTVRLLISPEDALGLATILAETGLWMIATEDKP